jgi:hypothetical protein
LGVSGSRSTIITSVANRGVQAFAAINSLVTSWLIR